MVVGTGDVRICNFAEPGWLPATRVQSFTGAKPDSPVACGEDNGQSAGLP
jgi:hypothetical protein